MKKLSGVARCRDEDEANKVFDKLKYTSKSVIVTIRDFRIEVNYEPDEETENQVSKNIVLIVDAMEEAKDHDLRMLS